MHANSPAEAFDRILILSLRGGLSLAERAIHILVGMAVDLIVHLRRGYDGSRTVRYVSEILEVMPPGDTDRPAVNRLFLPDPQTGLAVPACTPSPGLLARLNAAGFDADVLSRSYLPGQRARGTATVIALSAVAGGLTVGGLLLLLHEFSRPEAARHVPRWGGIRLRPATRKRPC